MNHAHPLVTRPADAVAVMPPRLLPEAGYYAVVASYPRAIIDWSGRYDRSLKATHRFDIADTRGRLALTVPVARPAHGARWADVVLSDHGRWQETLPTALESAYGRTPFFEYYADRLLPIIATAAAGEPLMAFAAKLDRAVRVILGLPADAVTFAASAPEGTDAARPTGLWPETGPYWQVRDGSLGFIARLSVLDLIFNLGPEAPLKLRGLQGL